jgi:spore coat protein A, manganese oxidase
MLRTIDIGERRRWMGDYVRAVMVMLLRPAKTGAMAAAAAAALLAGGAPRALAQQPALLDPLTQPKFVHELPIPSVIEPTVPGGSHYEVFMTQFEHDMGLLDPETGAPLLTRLWGYNESYPGPTFETWKNEPITVRWNNELIEDDSPLPHLLPVDTSLHFAASECFPWCGVPLVTHLHGGHTESESDGLPESWFTPRFAQTGLTFTKGAGEPYLYDNDQEAGTLWYHDHAMGLTRLNVYAGLAGVYLIRDAWEQSLKLPSGAHEIPLLIQDRKFTKSGQVFMPSAPPVPGAPDKSVQPGFLGDVIVVNGKAWPVLDVKPQKYRFRVVNASDTRFYNLELRKANGKAGPKIHQIGTELGLLDGPVSLKQLLLAPAERADIVIDFSSVAGQTLILRNSAEAPYPLGPAPNLETTGQVMAFRVGKHGGKDSSQLPARLRPWSPRMPAEPQNCGEPSPVTRQLIMSDELDSFGRLTFKLGTVAEGRMHWMDPNTENPTLGDTEVWEIFNMHGNVHPLHLHLVNFRILNRQDFEATVDPMTGALTDIEYHGSPKPPEKWEAGPKDTVQVTPHQVTRIIAKFDRPGDYVWHCHILQHEDHDMMRPFQVVTPSL